MFCPICNSNNSDSARVCAACGTALKAASQHQNGARQSAAASPFAAAEEGALGAGTVLGDIYHIERVLGQGGFGITYGCRDERLQREVAVKEFFPFGCLRHHNTVQPSRALAPAAYNTAKTRFLDEARTLARFKHPGIVDVYTAFEENNTAYMVMEYLEGRGLDDVMRERGGRLPEEEAIAYIERAGDALGAVHQAGLLHRDLKPENIMLCADGRIMLIDFGTARESAGGVQGHTVVVTPGYAPLEQYAQQAKRGAYTDVYGLAATLYHLLTGEVPAAASDRAMGVELKSVRALNPHISPTVARAIEAALQIETAKRPQSVREFLDLLTDTAWLDTDSMSQSIPAAQVAAWDAAYLAPGFGTTSAFDNNAFDDYVNLIQARERLLRSATSDPQFLDYLATQPAAPPLAPPLANPLASLSPLNVSPNALATTPPNNPPAPTYTLPLSALPASPTASSDPQHRSKRRSPATLIGIGLFLLIIAGYLIFHLRSGNPQMISTGPAVTVGGNIYPLPVPQPIRRPASTLQLPNGMPRIAPAATGGVMLPHRAVQIVGWRRAALSYTFSPDASLLASAISRTVYLWDVRTAWLKRTLTVSKGQVFAIAFSPDGKLLASGANDNTVRLWNVATGRFKRMLHTPPPGGGHALCFSPDSKTIAVGGRGQDTTTETEQQLGLWSVATGAPLRQFRLIVPPGSSSDVEVHSVAFSPDGKLLAAAGDFRKNTVRAWNTHTGSLLWMQKPSGTGWFTALAFSPDGKILAGAPNTQVLLWDARTGQQQALEEKGANAYTVDWLAFSRDGRFLANRGEPSNNIHLWDAQNWTWRRTLTERSNRWRDTDTAAFTPDGRSLIGLHSYDGTLLTWRISGVPGSVKSGRPAAMRPAQPSTSHVPVTAPGSTPPGISITPPAELLSRYEAWKQAHAASKADSLIEFYAPEARFGGMFAGFDSRRFHQFLKDNAGRNWSAVTDAAPPKAFLKNGRITLVLNLDYQRGWDMEQAGGVRRLVWENRGGQWLIVEDDLPPYSRETAKTLG